MREFATIAFCLSLAATISAQWAQQTTGLGTPPAARYRAAMAVDPNAGTAGKALLYGGGDQLGLLATSQQCFSYDFSTRQWTNHPLPGAANLWGASMCYHPPSGKLLLFGGLSQGGYQNATYAWNWTTGSWGTALPTNTPPAGRDDAAYAYHPGLGQVVMMGGDNVANLNDTWYFTYNTPPTASVWTAQTFTLPTTPNTLCEAAMVWDSTNSVMRLTGGSMVSGGALSIRTYSLNTGTPAWVQTGTNLSLGRTLAPGLWNGRSRRLTTFCGSTSSVPLNVTNTLQYFTGTAFATAAGSTTPSPSNRTGVAVAFNAGTNEVILHGGRTGTNGYDGQTWLWYPSPAATVSNYGAGCNGVTTTGTETPRMGLNQSLVFNYVTNGVQLGASLLSGTQNAGVPIPGAPGCTAYVNIVNSYGFIVDPLTNQGIYTRAIPFSTSLLGIALYEQGIIFDVTANSAGLVTSAGIISTIGY